MATCQLNDPHKLLVSDPSRLTARRLTFHFENGFPQESCRIVRPFGQASMANAQGRDFDCRSKCLCWCQTSRQLLAPIRQNPTGSLLNGWRVPLVDPASHFLRVNLEEGGVFLFTNGAHFGEAARMEGTT